MPYSITSRLDAKKADCILKFDDGRGLRAEILKSKKKDFYMVKFIKNKIFYPTSFVVLLVGNFLVSVISRLWLKAPELHDLYTILNVGVLTVSSFVVIWFAYKLNKRTFLYVFAVSVLILCFLTYVLFGFYSPFSLLSYFMLH